MKNTWEKLLHELMLSYMAYSRLYKTKNKSSFLEELFVANNVRGR